MFTRKQAELIATWKRDGLKRINLLEGSVRSGKTWISLVLWALWVGTMPRDHNYLMAAKTLTSLRRNCLDLLQSLIGERYFSYSIPRKEARLFGRLVYLEGANDARSESKIRGMTLQGAYCDELTELSADFFAMLLSRLSDKGAKLIATTNPDAPTHWLMRDYISRADELDMLDVRYTIDDNTFLDPEYVAQIKREYTGVFYERFILGKWVRAEGLVYDFFGDKHIAPPPEKAQEYAVSMDYGTQNPTAMLLWARSGRVWYAAREYYYSGREQRHQKTDEDYYDALCALCGDLPIQRVICDPSAASMIATIRQHGKFIVKKANNAVVDGIRVTAREMQAGRVKICPECVNTIKEIKSYAWDTSAAEDRPLKINDHAMDAMRYFCMDVFGKASSKPRNVGGLF